MTKSEKLKHCAGCRDNYYNCGNNFTTGYCWMIDKMKIVWRKEISIDQRPPWTQKAKRFPHCYRRPRYAYKDPKVTC